MIRMNVSEETLETGVGLDRVVKDILWYINTSISTYNIRIFFLILKKAYGQILLIGEKGIIL